MTSSTNSNILLKDRYRLAEALGEGGLGVTYRAEDLQTHRWVAVKAVVLREIKDWKVLDLLERETAILQSLDHPAIPQYLDSFEIDTDHNRTFYLVQELAPGQTLAQWMEQGWRPSRAEVLQIAQEILEILVYLQSFTPPIIHRDIKPQNLLRSPDGQIYLVDFGSVQDTYRHTVTGGSTVVGTFGYMAPEQFRGQAEPATDLYGLGATLIFLLTGKDPAELPQKKLRIDFRKAIAPTDKLDPFLGRWLDSLIAPSCEARLSKAKTALATLVGNEPLPDALGPGDRLQLKRDETSLLLEIGPIGFRMRRFRILTLISCITTLVMWIGLGLLLVIPYAESFLRRELAIAAAGLLVGGGVSIGLLGFGCHSGWLELTPQQFRLGVGPKAKRSYRLWGIRMGDFPLTQSPYSSLKGITFVRSQRSLFWQWIWRCMGFSQTQQFEMWVKTHKHASHRIAYALRESEVEFIREQIREFLTTQASLSEATVDPILRP